ncbi:MAG TPA: hypothetical protein PLD20_05235 [Blastocatellia bacterium]|nr:hypothetical protein [Blastocatellia bacterium]HMX27829.1 hypothetical protein [Blastocatellia bacterium]HMZ17311.1 hypothetical protein [Blastocatellia bacterium]
MSETQAHIAATQPPLSLFPAFDDDYGVIESSVFPGLRLNIPAMLVGTRAAVPAELQTELNSPEHATFVGQLSRRKTENKKLKTEN